MEGAAVVVGRTTLSTLYYDLMNYEWNNFTEAWEG